MRLPRLSIENSPFVIIATLMVVIAGVLSYQTMPRSEDPNLELPIYIISAVWPGTTPDDLEELVANPIEDAIGEIREITEIVTTIREGVVIVEVEADFGVDIEDKEDEIASEINRIRDDLPDGLYNLEVETASPKNVAFFQLALVAEGMQPDWALMIQEAERIEKQIEGIDGIRGVDVEAYPEEEVRVELDFDRLGMFHVPLTQVIGVLQGNNSNIPAGTVDAAGRAFSVRTSGSYNNLYDLRKTVIGGSMGRVVRLEDVATVSLAPEEDRWMGRFNGQACLFLTVTQEGGGNILHIADDVENKLAEIKSELPSDLSLHTAFEQAPAVRSRVNDFFLNLLQGILLVGVVVLIFLGGRPSLVVMTVIPVSILAAIFVLDKTGFGLQQISIAGLVIALGLLVDNGIVVLENILRFRREGANWKTAAVEGTSEVGPAVISSTATTLLAFFPLTQIAGGTGLFLKSLPLIVIYALIASLLLAMTLTPVLAGRMIRRPLSEKPRLVLRGINRFVEGIYQPVLEFCLRRPYVPLLISVITLGGVFSLFPAVGVSFFPTADKPVLLIEVQTPEGAALSRTDDAVRWVESVLDTSAFVSNYASNVGHGNPQIYYNRAPGSYTNNFGQLLVNLESWDPPRFYRLLGELRATFAEYPEAKVTFAELKNGPPFEAPIAIKIIGSDFDSLRNLSYGLEDLIRETPGTINVRNPLATEQTGLRFAVNRDKAGQLGVQLSDLDLAVRTGLAGLRIDELTMGGEEYNLSLHIPRTRDKAQVDDLGRVSVQTVTGADVPLRQLGRLQFDRTLAEISHYDRERAVTVTADVLDSDATAGITEDIIGRLPELPRGYRYYIAGEYETQQSSFGDLGVSLILAMIAIFAILVLQFRSLMQPLIVFSAIPLAFIGSILALYITGWSFSFFAFVGFTSLVGIVVNNSIILVDYANRLRQTGLSKVDAVLQSASTRFTPIMLTSLTTIVGLLPLTLAGTNLWSPLGWTIIGGMISSTLLVLLIVPVLYKLFSPKTVEVEA